MYCNTCAKLGGNSLDIKYDKGTVTKTISDRNKQEFRREVNALGKLNQLDSDLSIPTLKSIRGSCLVMDGLKGQYLSKLDEISMLKKTLSMQICMTNVGNDLFNIARGQDDSGKVVFIGNKKTIHDITQDVRNTFVNYMINQYYTLICKIHKHNIYHCDIKLENMTFDGHAFYLIDFGHASYDDERPGLGTKYFQLPHNLEMKPDMNELQIKDLFTLTLAIVRFWYTTRDETMRDFIQQNDVYDKNGKLIKKTGVDFEIINKFYEQAPEDIQILIEYLNDPTNISMLNVFLT